jgi:glycosyltransferase involved in cell wall biosynthesis
MTLRVGIVCDLREERWHSMDLVADRLAVHLPDAAPGVHATLLRPALRRRATALPVTSRWGAAQVVDRYWNRYIEYARWLRPLAGAFDVFHVVDHSYAHLVHALPASRTVVTCHDIDAFRCLSQPVARPVYRPIARRLLRGLRAAAIVTCDTMATRDELVSHGLLPADRLLVVPNGVHPAFVAAAEGGAAIAEADRLLGSWIGPEVLHVGSAIPRKRIDVLLRAVAHARSMRQDIRLIRVGGPLTGAHRALAARLGVENSIVEAPFVSPAVLAAIYRRAALTLLPSDAEGFGLPLVESMASGTVVLSSASPALREVGGDAAEYCTGDARAWGQKICDLLAKRDGDPEAWRRRQEDGRRRASGYTWAEYARLMGVIYGRLGARAAGPMTALSAAGH